MEFGRYDKLPHYAVHGDATNFYVWVNEDGKGSSSKWIKGSVAFELYNVLRNFHKIDKQMFCDTVKSIHTTYSGN
jgi:hypothetical protein